MKRRYAPPPSDQAESPTAKCGRSVSLDDFEETKTSLWLAVPKPKEETHHSVFLRLTPKEYEVFESVLLTCGAVKLGKGEGLVGIEKALMDLLGVASAAFAFASGSSSVAPEYICLEVADPASVGNAIKRAFGENKEALAVIMGALGIEAALNAVSDAAPTLNITVEAIGDNSDQAESPTAKSGRSVSIGDIEKIMASRWFEEQLDRIQKFLEEHGADDGMLDAVQFLLEQNDTWIDPEIATRLGSTLGGNA